MALHENNWLPHMAVDSPSSARLGLGVPLKSLDSPFSVPFFFLPPKKAPFALQ